MDGETRWASPVLRPRPPCSERVRRYSIPAGLYSTNTELQLDYDAYEANHHEYVTTAGRRALRADRARDSRRGESAYGEIRTETHGQRRNQRRYSKSFSSGDFVRGEGLDKHRANVRRWTVLDDSTRSKHAGCDADRLTSSSSSLSPALSLTSTDSGKHLHHHRPVMQVAEEALPGAQERRRPGPLLKQRDRTPAISIDDGAVLHAHHVSSSLSSSSSSSSSSSVSRVNTASDAPSHCDARESISLRPPYATHRRLRRQSSAGESASIPVPPPGSNLRGISSGRSRRKSTSVLPSISHIPSTPNTGMTSLPTPPPSRHGPGSRKGLAALGSLQSRSLPEEGVNDDDDDDSSAVHSDFLLLTRKKKINTNVSQEYKLAMDDLKISGPKPPPKVGNRLLSKRWSTLQSSVLAKKHAAGSTRTSGDDRSSTTGSSSELSRDGKLEDTDDANNNDDPVKPHGGRGWEIVRAKLKTIADMAPKDSIDSKPLTFRNIADLVKAKEFRLMMKRRTSFIEKGRFQFDEAKQDLYRRYGGRATPNAAPAAPAETHNSHGRKNDGGNATRVVNRRRFVSLSGSV